MDEIMSKLVHFAVKRRVWIISVTAVLTLFFAGFATQVQFNPNIESMVPNSDVSKRNFEEMGISASDYIAYTATADDAFTPEQLRRFDAFVKDVLKIEGIKDVKSPFNQIQIVKKGKSFFGADPIIGGIEAIETQEDADALKDTLMNNYLTRNLVVSEDGKTLVALFTYDSTVNLARMVDRILEVEVPLKETFETAVTGMPVFERSAKDYIFRDLPMLLVFSLIFVMITYFLGFRAARAVFLPMSVVVFGTVWAVGLMGMFGFPLTVVSIVTPPIVLTLGSSYSIHILNVYYRRARSHQGETDPMWIADAVSEVNNTIFLASATTVVGLLSLLATTLTQTRQFAISTSFGIIACAVLSLFYLPAALAMMKNPTSGISDKVNGGLFSRCMQKISTAVLKARYIMVALFFVFLLLTVIFFGKINRSVDYAKYYPEGDFSVRMNEIVSERIGGVNQIYFSFEAPDGQGGYFTDPGHLEGIAAFQQILNEDPDFTFTLSVVDFIKDINFKKNGKSELPSDKGLMIYVRRALDIAKRSGASLGDDIRLIVNDDFSRVSIIARIYDSESGSNVSDDLLNRKLIRLEQKQKELIPAEITYTAWGNRVMFLDLADTMIRDQFVSLFLSALLIFFLTALVFKSPLYGLLSLLPIVCGIIMNYLLMIVSQIQMDMTTTMVSSIAVGIGVDNAIHYLLTYRRVCKEHPDETDSEHLTLTTVLTGRPILLTSLGIVGGLLLLCLSSFKPIGFFGLLVAFTLFATTIGTLTFLPACLSIGCQWRKKFGKTA